MSTRTVRFAPPIVALAVACAPAAYAQDSAQNNDTDMIGPVLEEAEKAYRVPEPEPERPSDCATPIGNEIVVCAPIEGDPDRYRVTSRLDEGDDSHLEWTGQAPDVSGPGIFKGPATVGGLCIIPPCPKDPVYYFDIEALPEAPPGSDADRIARGLAPRGSRYDGGSVKAGEREEPAPESGNETALDPAGDTAPDTTEPER